MDGWGIPATTVLATVVVWYLVDPAYNDFQVYQDRIGSEPLEKAGWQVCLFLVCFAAFVPFCVRGFCVRLLHRGSSIGRAIICREFESEQLQSQLRTLLVWLAGIWATLMVVALFKVGFDFRGLFAPYMGHKANPWGRARIGAGFDAILSLASYFQIFLTATFGVLAALLKNSRYRALAIGICVLGFPFYIFDRARNVMLATMMPGFLAWVFLRWRGSLITRCVLLGTGFLVVNFWFAFVLSSRSDSPVSQAFSRGLDVEELAETRHLGLNMYEELAWINLLVQTGSYEINWGQRYFAELANPVPRAIWPGKPLIGIDYAIARGQGGGADSAAGVHATISTGMIGQGVVNFGPYFGPAAAAWLMAMWVALLTQQDLIGTPARQMLYALGLILTFNIGRDITLLVLYPFLFGYFAIFYWERNGRGRVGGGLR